MQETEAYIKAKIHFLKQTGAGILLLFLGTALLLLLSAYLENSIPASRMEVLYNLPAALLLLCTASAIVLFVKAGIQFEKYEYMENSSSLEPALRDRYEAELAEAQTAGRLAVTLALLLGVLGLLLFLILQIFSQTNRNLAGILAMLAMLTAAVLVLLYGLGRKAVYFRLLSTEVRTPEQKKKQRVMETVASIVWPLTIAVFLVCITNFQRIQTAWMIFPVVGVCFGAFVSICNAK